MNAMQRPPHPIASAPTQVEMLPAYDVRDLMQSGTQVRMVLDGTVYFLRITRSGKLILTK